MINEYQAPALCGELGTRINKDADPVLKLTI